MSGIKEVLGKIPKLGLYESKVVGTFSVGEESFTIRAGLDRTLADQLVTYTKDDNDRALKENTHDKDRFEKGYDKWFLEKERTPFALVNSEGKLAAVVWFGPSDMPEGVKTEEDEGKAWETIALRSYGEFRGRGLTSPFLNFVWHLYTRSRPDASYWAVTNSDNGGMKHLLQKFHFSERGKVKNAEGAERTVYTLH